MRDCPGCKAKNPQERLTCYGCGSWLESPSPAGEPPAPAPETSPVLLDARAEEDPGASRL
jgi:hypothetical protein